tara:strand:- start:440 stop:793 length:354 start_codon:yes stop_codon:yes gene_type:complete
MDDELKYLEQYYDRRNTPKAKRKRLQNELYYAKVLGTGWSNRITVPTCADDHVENARVCFTKLSKALNDIAKDDLRPQQALRETKAAIYECHVELKRRADFSLKYPRSPETDFRNAR